MAQAKRRKSAKTSPKKRSNQGARAAYQAFKQSFGFFAAGVLAGAVGLIYWQGYQSSNPGDLGSGIRSMMDDSRQQDIADRAKQAARPDPVLVDNTPRVKTEYGFYTVLPEFEEVLPKDGPPPEPIVALHKPKKSPASKTSVSKTTKASPQKLQSAYMLQVASLGRKQDAETLKAQLVLKGGLRASVQEVSIDGKKYYRIRVGPYAEFKAMEKDDKKLTRMGHKAIRMRVSSPG